MRRTLLEKEETPARIAAPAPLKQSEAPVRKGQSEEQKPARSKKATHTPGNGRALRGGLLLFGSLGIFILLVPSITGMPLSEWFKGANFGSAYSLTNFHYIRGSGALKVGNLSGATSALMALPPQSSESIDLAAALYPQVLNAGDYVSAVQIWKHSVPDSILQGDMLTRLATEEVTTILRESGAMSLDDIGRHMNQKLGVEKAIALVEREPELNSIRGVMVPSILTATIYGMGAVKQKDPALFSQRWAALEKLTQSSSGLFQTETIKALITLHTGWYELEPAWKWSLKLPKDQQFSHQEAIISKCSITKPEETLRLLQTLGAGEAQDMLRVTAIGSIVEKLPAQREALLASIKTPKAHDLALGALISQKNTKEDALLFNQIKDPRIKMNIFVYLGGTGHLTDTTPINVSQLTAFVRQNSQFTKEHDDLLRWMTIQENNPKFIASILDPAYRAATQQEWNEGKQMEAILPWGNGGELTASRRVQKP